jgi:hypothetical protein
MTFALNDTSATEILKCTLEKCEKMMYLSNSERSIVTTKTNENEIKREFVNIFSQDGQKVIKIELIWSCYICSNDICQIMNAR